MILIDGKATAATIVEELKPRTAAFEQKYGKKIGLAVVLIGDDPASAVYVRNKIKKCADAGILSLQYRLPAETSQEEAETLAKKLAADPAVHGLLVQLPLPKHLNTEKILAEIPAYKDVDGFCSSNIGSLAMGKECTVACTPLGVMELLKRYQIPVAGKRAVVLGRSNIVGKPMAMLLLNADATVTVCHSKTQNLKEECLGADILVAAIGKPKFVTEDMVKEGAVVIDVGINRDENGLMCGDVDFEKISKKASYMTPVPGGVGPMTIAMLLANTVRAAEMKP